MKRETWAKVKSGKYFGVRNIELEGFIHCSPVEYMWRVTPNFKKSLMNWFCYVLVKINLNQK